MPRKKELIFGRIYRPVRFKLVFPANKRKLVEKLITDRTNTSSITRAKITIKTKTWGNISFARYSKYWKIFKNLQIHKKLKGERNTRISRLISPLISRSDPLKILSNPQRTKKKKREKSENLHPIPKASSRDLHVCGVVLANRKIPRRASGTASMFSRNVYSVGDQPACLPNRPNGGCVHGDLGMLVHRPVCMQCTQVYKSWQYMCMCVLTLQAGRFIG